MTRYQAEFDARRKKPTENWADLADDMRSLADKAYPDLQAEARECLALQRYLQQLEQPQVAFGVKQTRPKTLDDAIAEMESYAATRPYRPEFQRSRSLAVAMIVARSRKRSLQ